MTGKKIKKISPLSFFSSYLPSALAPALTNITAIFTFRSELLKPSIQTISKGVLPGNLRLLSLKPKIFLSLLSFGFNPPLKYLLTSDKSCCSNAPQKFKTVGVTESTVVPPRDARNNCNR